MTKRKNNYSGITPAVIRAELGKGKTFVQIAHDWGVSKQAVWAMANRNGISIDPTRDTIRANFPWHVPKEFQQTKPYRYLLDHARFVIDGPEDMPVYQLDQLRSFYRKLFRDDSVLEFISGEGFEYHPRVEADDNLLIRVNDETKLTETGKRIWTRPTAIP